MAKLVFCNGYETRDFFVPSFWFLFIFYFPMWLARALGSCVANVIFRHEKLWDADPFNLN